MSEQQQQTEVVPFAEPLPVIEKGAPPIGEMVPTYIYICPVDRKTRFSSYHTVTDIEQLKDMCPHCQAIGHQLTRIQHNTIRNEFAAEFVLCHTGDIEYDDHGAAYPIKPGWSWSIFRVPISIRPRYSLHAFGRYLGFGPLIVRIGLDAGDRQIRGQKKEVEDDSKKKYEGTSILMTYLLEHGKRVAWSPSKNDPIPAYDEENKSPYVTEFEYHREKGA